MAKSAAKAKAGGKAKAVSLHVGLNDDHAIAHQATLS